MNYFQQTFLSSIAATCLCVLLPFSCQSSSGSVSLSGTLGEFDARLELTLDGSSYRGKFVYADTSIHRGEIKLHGSVAGNQLMLSEFTEGVEEATGTFIGKYVSPDYAGFWHSPDGRQSVPFSFKEEAPFGKTSKAKVTYEMTHKREDMDLYGGLLANVQGRRYIVFEPESDEEYIANQLVLSVDLNDDGYEEALIVFFEGGNVTPFEYSVYTYDPSVDSFFHVRDFGSSWKDPILEEISGRRCIKIDPDYSENDTPGLSDMTSWYSLDGHTLAIVQRIIKLPIPAFVELTLGSDPDFLLVDVNRDGYPDTIAFDHQMRWDEGWTLLFGGGLVDTTSGSGRRVGVLQSMTNGYFDLVSDLDEVYRWNGTMYVSDRPEEEEEEGAY